jgi:EpsI family protein
VYCTRWIRLGKISTSLAWVFAVVFVLLSGIAYRVLASHLKLLIEAPITLPMPLSAFPEQIGDWAGKDLPIPNTTREYMEKNFADDFLSRRYINATANTWADVYIVYCSSQPGGILGHQPRVCYPGNGWIHDSTEQSQFFSQSGRQIPCLVHRFHKPAPAYDQTVVLNFYILNGQITTEEKDFSGLLGRRPNIAGNPARYVAQVQISSVLENSIREATKDMTDWILDFFPNENGKVKATESIQTLTGDINGKPLVND